MSLSPLVSVGLAAWVLAGCSALHASPPIGPAPKPAAPASAAVAASAPAPAASAPAPRPAPASSLRAFDDVVAGAQRIDGVIALWQRDDKVWLELAPGDFGQPFFLSPKLKTGIGDGRFYGGRMAGEQLVEFRRVHNQLQLLIVNSAYRAPGGAATGAFSPSLLGSAPVLSQPHPERRSVLVEANAIFVTDLLGLGAELQRHYRQGYAFDARHSAVTAVRGGPDLSVIEVMNHYAAATVAAAPATTPPVPDGRSLFLTLHYALARLPAVPMQPRRADARIGHFTTSFSDFADELARSPRRRLVNRWRLEKADPAAPLSDPVKPITYWLDRSIPERYREPIREGILEWNRAFEKIGFRDAIRVELQPEGADFDLLDVGRASVRWLTSARPSFGAIGPSHVDPRSGEILDADIAIESLSSRAMRSARAEVLAPRLPDLVAAGRERERDHRHAHGADCEYADQATEQLAYAVDVLEARGEIDPAGPQAEQFIAAYLKDVVMHEVGHTLGLRHNFRSSRVYSEAQLADPVFTASHSLSGSVMEYSPVNLPLPGLTPEQRPRPFNATLGPYDEWAVEYAYRPLPPGLDAAAEAAELARIAGRSHEPQLAYGTDEDHYLGIDPETLTFDLGSDVIAFARKRVTIARDLLARQEKRELAAGSDYSALRRSVGYALRDMNRAAGLLARQIGGVRTLRDHAGSGREPLVPLPASQQRAALDLLASNFLSADSFPLSAALQRRLAVDFQERGDSLRGGDNVVTDFSAAAQIGDLQRNVLSQLMSDSVAARLIDSEAKSPHDALRLAELYARLDKVVWSELRRPGDIPAARRELQRDHMNRLAVQLLRPASLSRADARSLLRAQAERLQARLRSAARAPGLSALTRAHLQDSANTLNQALDARLERSGV